MNQTQHKEYNASAGRYQQIALPITQNIAIAENEPVAVANAQLEELDYRKLYRAYSPNGRKSVAEPRIMFKLLVYGYMCGIYSTRKLEEACRKNIDFIWLLQGERVPDHSSFARFRSGKAKEAIEDLFYQYVRKLAQEGETEYEEVFIDGTKIESMANRYTFVWRRSVEKQLSKLKEKAKALFYQYGGQGSLTMGKFQHAADSLVPEGGELVHGSGRRKPVWQRQYEEAAQLLERWKRYESQLFEMGCKRNSLSKTDPDATFMRMKEDHMGNGQLKPAYNVQLAVNSEYIIGAAAFSNCTDSGTLIPFLDHIQRMHGASCRDVVADAGYEHTGNYLYLENHGQTCYVKPTNYEAHKTKKYRQQIWRVENMQYLEAEDSFVCAAQRKLRFLKACSKKAQGIATTCKYYRCEDCSGCPLREQCTKSVDPNFRKEVKLCEEFADCRQRALQRLVTERGALLRMNRSIQVEGAFGVLKHDRNFKRFLMRGRTNISLELFLLCLAFDLRKYCSKLQQGRLRTHLFPLKKE